jgi:hypothetical protein
MPSESLFRLTYASTSAFKERGGGTAIAPEVARILQACKVNNPKHGVGGVLHYGDGYFFQVLEGGEEDVRAIYAKIAGDARHRDVRTLDTRPVARRRFPDWSMKYVPLETDVNKVLKRYRLSEFNPYQFDAAMIEELIELLVGSPASERPDRRGARGWLRRLFGKA